MLPPNFSILLQISYFDKLTWEHEFHNFHYLAALLLVTSYCMYIYTKWCLKWQKIVNFMFSCKSIKIWNLQQYMESLTKVSKQYVPNIVITYVTGFTKTVPIGTRKVKSNLLLNNKPTLLHYLEMPST